MKIAIYTSSDYIVIQTTEQFVITNQHDEHNLFFNSLLFFTADIFDRQIWQKLLMERSTL